MVILYPIGDTYIDKHPSYRDSNFSTATKLHISNKRYTWDARKRQLFQFDISELTGYTIDSAKFTQYWEYTASPGQNLSIKRTTAAWNPSIVTWNNQPSYSGTGGLTYLKSWMWGTSSEIKALMQAAIDAEEETFGIVILFTDEESTAPKYGRCRSIETTSKPYLTVEYTGPPPPPPPPEFTPESTLQIGPL